MKKTTKIFVAFLSAFSVSFWAFSAQAVCPICTLAVGAGIGLSRWLGIDDTITGSWIGALLVSVSLWTIDWVSKKSWKFRGYKIAIFSFYLILIVGPLFWKDIFWHPLNKLWGVDKLILGMVSGMIFFSGGVFLNEFLKKKNEGKVFFPFQKIVLNLALLIILSGIFYFLTK